MRRKDLWIAPSMEGFLLLVVSVIAWVVGEPLIFASLGPTAFEQVETPRRPSARPYNIIVGHVIAVLCAFFAVWVLGAWGTPSVSMHRIPLLRVWAITLGAVLTVLFTLLARATQPAALATMLLIATGMMPTWEDGVAIVAGVLLITALGEPLRRWRIRMDKGPQMETGEILPPSQPEI